MKNSKIIITGLAFFLAFTAYSQVPEKYVSSKSHIKFYSTTPVEDIEANNYASVSTLKPALGEFVFSVPMQSFEFEKAKMQEHFNNEHFLETNVYPKAKLKAKITNLSDVDFSTNGEYKATIKGELTIKGVTKPITESGTITISPDGVKVSSKFFITLADYGILFDEGEMVSKKIAKEVETTVTVEYN